MSRETGALFCGLESTVKTIFRNLSEICLRTVGESPQYSLLEPEQIQWFRAAKEPMN